MKKKLLLFACACFMSSQAVAQQKFFDVVEFRGAIGAEDWTRSWTNFNPDTVNYPSATVPVTGDIISNVTWTADKVYDLTGFVTVKNNATLTIEPGTIIRGTSEGSSAGALIITRGAKIIAEGTAEKPIVFTSNQPAGARSIGNWAGIMIFGNAVQNVPTKTDQGYRETFFEVFTADNADVWYGGNNDEDSSGILKFVRIEYAGWYSTVDKEINGLTLGAVGSKTVLENIQVSYTNDDSFEWFGGTVNGKRLISFAAADDDFDTDQGFRGNIQYAIGLRHPALWDFSTSSGASSRGFESDNNSGGTAVAAESDPQPATAPVFSNVTLLGYLTDGQTTTNSANKVSQGIIVRTNSSLSLFNSVVAGFPRGIALNHWNKDKSPSTYSKALIDSVSFQNVVLANNPTKLDRTPEIPAADAAFNVKSWFGNADYNNDTTSFPSIGDLQLINPVVDTVTKATPSVAPKTGSPLLTGATFVHPRLSRNSQVTGINDATETNLQFTVFPSAFSESTTFTYHLQNSGIVSIDIYDIKGNKITEVVKGWQMPGTNTITLDATLLPKGVCFAQAVTGKTVKTLKLIIQ